MIKKYERPLNEKEKKILNNDIAQVAGRFQKSNRAHSIMTLIILGVGVAIAISQINKNAVLGYSVTACVAVYLLIALWARIEEKIKSNKATSNIKEALIKNIASVIHCQSDQFIKLDEIEDEGPHYLFQVDENRIFALGGQEFYENGSFPNSDFEIVTAYGKSQYPVLLEKYLYGNKLKPVKTITKQDKMKLMQSSKYPDVDKFQIIEGKLENIGKILA